MLFAENIDNYKDRAHVIESPVEYISLTQIPFDINIFFYDGDHSHEAYQKSFTALNPVFDDIFISIIDDYNWLQVQEAIDNIYKEYVILYDCVLGTAGEDPEDFWNGLRISVLHK